LCGALSCSACPCTVHLAWCFVLFCVSLYCTPCVVPWQPPSSPSHRRKRTKEIFARDVALALEHNVRRLCLIFSAWIVRWVEFDVMHGAYSIKICRYCLCFCCWHKSPNHLNHAWSACALRGKYLWSSVTWIFSVIQLTNIIDEIKTVVAPTCTQLYNLCILSIT